MHRKKLTVGAEIERLQFFKCERYVQTMHIIKITILDNCYDMHSFLIQYVYNKDNDF